MVNAILWILRTGAPWRDLPEYYPAWKSVHSRFSRWSAQGIWTHVLLELSKAADTEGYHIDGTIVKAHQDVVGSEKGGSSDRPFARRSVHEDPRCRQP